MSENKYEQRIRQRAEEMAIAVTGSKFGHSSDHWDGYMKIARLSVQREAEVYVKGRTAGYDLGIAWEKGEQIVVTPNFELQSLGLVPDNVPDQEAGKG